MLRYGHLLALKKKLFAYKEGDHGAKTVCSPIHHIELAAGNKELLDELGCNTPKYGSDGNF